MRDRLLNIALTLEVVPLCGGISEFNVLSIRSTSERAASSIRASLQSRIELVVVSAASVC
jgi:hypothetical protein